MAEIYEFEPELEPRSGTVNTTAVTIISLCFPGVGQLIMGQVGKGLAMIALSMVLFFVWPPLIVIIDCFSAWDAYTGAQQRNASEQDQAEANAKIAETQITAETMIDQIEKLNALAKAHMLTAEELTGRRASVISLLETKTPAGTPENFLTALIPLVQAEGLTVDEVQRIKGLVFR